MRSAPIAPRWLTPILTLAVSAALALGGASAALAQEAPVKLSISPVGVAGSYFQLTLSPGETRELAVLIGNHGTAPVRARTYPADVYTIINGGFGARLSGEPTSGATQWVRYPSDVLSIDPGTGVRRTFTLTVPTDAVAGEHITSLVVQNDDPVTTGTGIAIRQVVRQAIAIAITVPGPLVPGLRIGAARHADVAGKSILGVEVENTGNVRLRPVAELTLSDATGKVVSTASVAMDSFYAGTSTLVELPLAALLRPGEYRIALTLTDAERSVRVEAKDLALTVLPPPATEPGAVGAVRELTAVAQELAGTVSLDGVSRVVFQGAVGLAAIATAVAIGGLLAQQLTRMTRPPARPRARARNTG